MGGNVMTAEPLAPPFNHFCSDFASNADIAHIQDTLALFLYNGKKWSCVIHRCDINNSQAH